MPIWFQILTGIFSIIGVLFPIAIAVFAPIHRYRKNKISTKSFLVSFSLEPPIIPPNSQFRVVKAYLFCTNKTNKQIIINKVDLIDGDKTIDVSSKKCPIAFSVEPNSNFLLPCVFALLSYKYQFPDKAILRLKIDGKNFDYPVSLESAKVEPQK